MRGKYTFILLSPDMFGFIVAADWSTVITLNLPLRPPNIARASSSTSAEQVFQCLILAMLPSASGSLHILLIFPLTLSG